MNGSLRITVGSLSVLKPRAAMRKLKVLLAVLTSAVSIQAQPCQNVSGFVTADTTWSGTVCVNDLVQVLPGVTLTISSGTEVELKNRGWIYVEGEIYAIGSREEKITMRGSGSGYSIQVGTIFLKSSAERRAKSSMSPRGTFRHVVFDRLNSNGGGSNHDYRAALRVVQSETYVQVSNSEFRNNRVAIYGGFGSSLSLDTVTIEDEMIWASSGVLNMQRVNFAGPRYGLENRSRSPIFAQRLWWGHRTGPYHPVSNPTGRGVPVSDDVEYGDWLSSPVQIESVIDVPRISLSSGSVTVGEQIIVSGQGFVPDGEVTVNVRSKFSNDEAVLTASSDGSFQWPYEIKHSGMYEVRAVDENSSTRATPQTFFSVVTSASTTFELLSPIAGTYVSDTPLIVEWQDRFDWEKWRQGGAYYRIDLMGSSGVWDPVDTVFVQNRTTKISRMVAPPLHLEPGVDYSVRVVDLASPFRIAMSAQFDVAAPGGGIGASLEWDHSHSEKPRVAPRGVAVDGLARLYLRVTPPPGMQLQSASACLRDAGGECGSPDYAWLGAVMPATETDGYSEEASGATTTSAVAAPDEDGDIWFWYVAPAFFGPSDEQARAVTVNVTATTSAGDVMERSVLIEVFRRPLALVHGINSTPDVWNSFDLGNGNIRTDLRYSPCQGGIRLRKEASFDFNAKILLRAIKGCISSFRSDGRAVAQVSYVAHSMGGNVMRHTVQEFASEWWSNANYGQGYVDRAITINTPHAGSPVPDLLEAVAQYIVLPVPISSEAKVEGIIVKDEDSGGFKLTPAAKDLRALAPHPNGKRFSVTEVPTHVIVSDLYEDDDFTDEYGDLDVTLDSELLAWRIREAMKASLPKELQPDFGGFGNAAAARTLAFGLKEYCGISDFVQESDFLVGTSSQLSGRSRESSAVSIFYGPNHTDIVTEESVIQKVSELLRGPFNSSKFASLPSSFSVGHPQSGGCTTPQKTSFPVEFVETDLMLPLTVGSSIDVGQPLSVHVSLPDTTGLFLVDVTFQGRVYSSTVVTHEHEFNLHASGLHIDDQQILVSAYYDEPLGGRRVEYDIEPVLVEPGSQATLLTALSDRFDTTQGDTLTTYFTAGFSTFASEITASNSFLSVSFEGESVVAFDPSIGRFLSLTPGSAVAYVNYRGASDTLYFSVTDPDDSESSIGLQTSVWIEGAYESGSMVSGFSIPTVQPYRAEPWNYAGTERAATTPAKAIDWVLVRLRDPASQVLQSQAAGLLMEDGRVVAATGSGPLSMNVSAGDYAVEVCHRNHGCTVSSTAVTVGSDTATYDFRANANEGQVDLGSGVWGLPAGDADADGRITALDALRWGSEATQSGYLSSDFNLDGTVDASDLQVFWLPNNGR